MQTPVQFKIFSAMILLAMLISGGLLAYIDWSFNKGFTRYYDSKGEEIAQEFIKVLIPLYQQHGNWEFLRHNRQQWDKITNSVARVVDPEFSRKMQQLQHGLKPPPEAGHPIRPRNRFDNRNSELDDDPVDDLYQQLDRDLQHARVPTPPKPTLAARFILLDINKHHLGGPPFWGNKTHFEPVYHNEQVIAYYGLDLSQLSDNPLTIVFFKDHSWGLLGVALAIMLLALLLTLPLARYILKPISLLRSGTQQMVDGNYQMHLKVDSRDELHGLAEDLNTLAIRLAENEKARKRWVADISHELRTPISVLQLNLEAIEDGFLEPEPDTIAAIRKRLGMLATLVNDLHELSQSDIGSLSYNTEPADVLQLLRESVNLCQPESEAKGLHCDYQINNTLQYRMDVDINRMTQVFSNLLKNSITYTDAPGLIRITATIANDGLHIFIDDSAPGVNNSEYEKIFDRLYRVESSRNRNTGGSGLGLAICRNIILAHKGNITASASPLGGLRMDIHLNNGKRP